MGFRGIDSYLGGRQVNPSTIFSDRTLNPAKFYSLGAAYKLSNSTTALVRYGESVQSAQNVQAMPGVTLSEDKQRKFELGVEQKISKQLNGVINYFNRNNAEFLGIKTIVETKFMYSNHLG
jgi:hypothetical protein